MNAYGAFQTFYQLQLLNTQTSSDIAWIGSTQAFLLFLVSIVAGPLFDAGRLRSLLWVGSGLVVVGMFLVSNPIAGAILGRDQDWVGLVVWCGVLLFASFVSMSACRIVKVGPGLTRLI